MKKLAILLIGLLTAACGAPVAQQEPSGGPANRIVSLDYCADQFVMKFVGRDRILAVSPDAARDYSYMRAAAVGLPVVRPVAEDVIILKPDLVVRSFGGGPNAAAFFERAGIPVLEVGWAGDIEAIMSNVQRMATELGASEQGRMVVAEMRERLAAATSNDQGGAVLYMTPAGVTSGPGSLIHEMMISAGLVNFEKQPGWRSIPLEKLAFEQPDLVAAAFFETFNSHPDAWTAMKHPIAQAQLEDRKVVPLQGATTACGGWFLVDAVEALAEGARK